MKKLILTTCALLIALLCTPLAVCRADVSPHLKKVSSLHEKPTPAPDKVEIKQTVADVQIQGRLEGILIATDWFIDPKVVVQNGVVFLTGQGKTREFKDWASELARNTQGVTAVVNKIVVLEPSVWDLHLVVQELGEHGRKVVRSLPAIFFGAILLFLSWILARLVYRLVPLFFRKDQVNPSLIHEVVARAVAFLVFLIGVYFIFEMADLTTMALTVISGTGLLGIILGIAFRDLAENFLASILLSLQSPFKPNDLIDLMSPASGYKITGYVERLTMRVTILVSLDGDHIQVPNSIVYKSNIVNHFSNPKHREAFAVNIEPRCSLSSAVDSALRVLRENDAILRDPEPLVLVDALEKESVKLQVCYWIDVKKHNPAKVKSSVMRLVKKAFQEEGLYESKNAQLEHRQDQISQGRQKPSHEAKKTQSEQKTQADTQPEKMRGLSSGARLPEGGKDLLSKDSKKEKKEEK